MISEFDLCIDNSMHRTRWWTNIIKIMSIIGQVMMRSCRYLIVKIFIISMIPKN